MKQSAITARLFSFLLFLAMGLAAAAQPARQTILFNEGWKFHQGDIDNGASPVLDDAGWRKLSLPHDWSIEGPFSDQWASATAYLPAGIGWYRKTFSMAPGERSKKVFLYFDGVYKNSEVWINGHLLGKRPNGFIPFQYEISNYLHAGAPNTVAVKVDHSQFADARWYTGSGIYRNVYLVLTAPLHIDLWGIRFTTPEVSAQSARADITVSINNQGGHAAPVWVTATLTDAAGKAVAAARQQLSMAAGSKADASLSFTVAHPALWSPEHPALYRLRVTLQSGGKQTDSMVETVGFRSFRFDRDKGFFLNGVSTKLKGVCIHDDAGALGVAVPMEAWSRRLRILKEAGCNSLRLSHNPHADYIYQLADQLGFLVMDEAFDEWEEGKNKWIKGWNVGTPGRDGYHSAFGEWAERDIADMVLRSRNRPSIILWSIGNEIDYPNDPYTHEILNTGRNPQIYGRGYAPGKPAAARLTALASRLAAAVKRYDTTRPVTAALAGVVMSNEVGYPETLDVVGYNYQEFRYDSDHKKYPQRVIYGSENGMALNAWKAVEDNEYIAGQYLWTGVDYLGEARSWPFRSNTAGLIDLAGFTKPAYYFRQSLWSEKPMVYIGTSPISKGAADKRNITASWNYAEGDSIRISCFTNCDAAELFLNGQSLGRKQLADAAERTITWVTAYHAGQLQVKGYRKGVEAASYGLKTAGQASTIQAKADRTSFDAGKKQLCHIAITITDQNGAPVNNADNLISVNLEGPATLLGLENGSADSHEDYKANSRKALNGKLLAYVQSQQKKGAVKITVSAAGLRPTVISLH